MRRKSRRGNTAVGVASTGGIASALRYDGYGKTLDSYNPASHPTPWKYQGRLDVSPDADAPLYDAGARFYAPAIGAFTQLDSYAGSAQAAWSLNRYLYAGANPTSMIDPDGHAFIDNPGSASGGYRLPPQRHNLVRGDYKEPTPRPTVYIPPLRLAASLVSSTPVERENGINPLKVAGGVAARQAEHLVELPGALWNLVTALPGAALAAPGAIADVAGDLGGAWDKGSSTVIRRVVDWSNTQRANLLSGDEDRIAEGISSSVDVAGVITAVGGLTKAAAASKLGKAEEGIGGAGPVRVGQAGEAAVRESYDIGPKVSAVVNGRTRIFDGLTAEAVSEVKNVRVQAYTQQLRDSVAYARTEGRRFDLYVRPDTYLTGPLQIAVRAGEINLRLIP